MYEIIVKLIRINNCQSLIMDIMCDKNEKRQLKRKFISLEDKVEILNRLRDGERISSVGKSFDLNESTVRTLKRNEEKIRKTMADSCPLAAKRTTRNRNTDIVKMERDLMIWLEDCITRNIPVNGKQIKQKALQIYNNLLKTKGSSGDDKKQSKFSASKGWLENLKKRYSLHNIKFQDEQTTYMFKEESPENCEDDNDNITHHMYQNVAENLMRNCSLNNETMKNIEKVNVTSHVTEKEFENDKNHHRDVKELLRDEISDDKKLIDDTTASNVLVNKDMDKELDSNWNLSTVKKGLDLAKQLKTFFMENDHSIERRNKFKRELKKCLTPYKELYMSLKLQNQNSI
ncbi:PREDICTED: uncharacterized protein LOC107065344 [Polistes dominula]|uniref:Uncharacterized protein LOC107065344 n=1 Tax=Polistes dominula TaxID=743375 RepID=A0ABM1I2J7_POLDO|nr:PREDICTED: uncharacterized protein LOC107065344 [Polistes dominula]